MSRADYVRWILAAVLGGGTAYVTIALDETVAVVALVAFMLTAAVGLLGFLGLVGSRYVSALFFFFGITGLIVFYLLTDALERGMVPH